MRRGDGDRNRRRPSLVLFNFGRGRLMASGERQRRQRSRQQGERPNLERQLHGIAAIPLRKSSHDRFGIRFERTRRQLEQPPPQRPGQHLAEHERRELRIDWPNRAAIDRVLQHRRHEIEMAGIDPHVFAAGFRFELDIQRVADDKRLQKILVRGLNSELGQDEFADSLQRRHRRIVRRRPSPPPSRAGPRAPPRGPARPWCRSRGR